MNQKTIREKTVHDAKRNLILDASRKVFSEKGLHEARLEDIAASAGFSKASLYNYFNDKDEIFLSLAIRDFEDLLEKIRSGITNPNISIHEALEYSLRTFFTFFGEQFAFFCETTHIQHTGNPEMQKLQCHHMELRKIFQTQYHDLLGSVTIILDAARKRGEIKTAMDDITILKLITALARGTIFEWKIQGKMGDVDKTVRDILEFASHGLGIENLNLHKP